MDVSNLARLPFEPAEYGPVSELSRVLGLDLEPETPVWVMPVIGGFVGGDIVGGILSTGLDSSELPSIMVDIGTNGEIVLAAGGSMRAASTAAGPAFEGARISCGMRATDGAIERVDLSEKGDLNLGVIGNEEPVGLCGSGLVDIGALLLDAGIVDSSGRMIGPDEAQSLPEPLARRLRQREGGNEFLVHDGPGPVVIRAKDVRELQLAAGAVRAGVNILLAQAGLAPGDVSRFLIAGGFGGYIRRRSAVRIGLIPPGIDVDCVEYVGNLSIHGAGRVLLSSAARARAESIARETEHVELSADEGFQNAFAEAMIFPEGRCR